MSSQLSPPINSHETATAHPIGWERDRGVEAGAHGKRFQLLA
jgi:hypothetical protein